jgi:hypothetical protein
MLTLVKSTSVTQAKIANENQMLIAKRLESTNAAALVSVMSELEMQGSIIHSHFSVLRIA